MKKDNFVEVNKYIQASNDLLKTIDKKHEHFVMDAADRQLRYAGCHFARAIDHHFNGNKGEDKCSNELKESKAHSSRAIIYASAAALHDLLRTFEMYKESYLNEHLVEAGIDPSEYYEKVNEANNLINNLDREVTQVTHELARQFLTCYTDMAVYVSNLDDKREYLDKIKRDKANTIVKETLTKGTLRELIKFGMVFITGLILQGYFKIFET